MSFGRRVAADVSGAYDHHALPHLGLAGLAHAEKIQGRDQPFFPGDGYNSRLLRAGGYHDEIEFLFELHYVGFFEPLSQVHVRKRLSHAGQFGLQDLIGDAGLRDHGGDFPAKLRPHIVDNRLMALLA